MRQLIVIASLCACLITGYGCVTDPDIRDAGLGSGVAVTTGQARRGIEQWLKDHRVDVLSKALGDIDGEVVIKTERGSTNVIRYEPYKDGLTFIQVLQRGEQQPNFASKATWRGFSLKLCRTRSGNRSNCCDAP